MKELQIHCNSSILAHYESGHEAEIIQEIEVSAISPMELVMNYMLKRINDIDQLRRKLRVQYPDLLPDDL